MAPTSLPTHLVYTVFQYILPPSLPIPLHLLSRPLIKRHHFLSISAENPGLYLCWPSPQTLQVIEALELSSQESLTSQPEHEVRYLALDQETLLAHVRPDKASPLQVVFAWDAETESWGYHDARMLPFPEGSSSSLDDALAQRPITVSEFALNDFGETSRETRSPSPASDNYWAGYDSSGSSPTTPAPVNVIAEEDDKAEAAYWASYGVVHGSGDSTMPSPAPEKNRILTSQKQGDLRGPDIPTDPFITHLHLRLHEHTGLLSPRLDSPRSELPDYPHLSIKTENPKTVESTAMNEEGEGVLRVNDLEVVGSRNPDEDAVSVMEAIPPSPGKGNGRREADEGAKEAVRGIYRIWKAHTPSADAGAFIEVVKSALESL